MLICYDYYGVLEEVVQLKYFGEQTKRVVLFDCHWFDPVIPRGTRLFKPYGIVEVRHRGKYNKYDPFILAQQAVQVYYMPYPGKRNDKKEWWVAMKTKPRSRVDSRHTLEVAYQEDEMSLVHQVFDNDSMCNLVNNNLEPEEVEENFRFEDNIVEEDEEEDGEEEEEEEEDTHDEEKDDGDDDDDQNNDNDDGEDDEEIYSNEDDDD